MTNLIACLLAGLFAAGHSLAQAPRTADPEAVIPEAAKRTAPPSIVLPGVPAQVGCEARALGKNGLPLAGAARATFMRKCETEALKLARANCAAKAVGEDGRVLAGSAKAAFVKKCAAEARVAK